MDKPFASPEVQTVEGSDPGYTAHWLKPYRFGRLLLVKTLGQEHERITELIAQWVLHGPFYLIAAGEWMPEHDDLRYAVYRHTVAFDKALDNLILARPFTCLQLLDLLIEADRQNKPILILDFLHLFYDADVDLSLRDSTLEQCCHYAKRLSFSNPVAVLVPSLAIEEYRRFFPLVASIADEIIESNEHPSVEASQGLLFRSMNGS
jgi:hypothetical protein